MSLPELAHRSWRAARLPIDHVRMRSGRYAPASRELSRWRGPEHFYFERAPAVTDAVRDRADAICRGERDVLGLDRLALPNEPWHVEPLASVEWPRVASPRVIASAPSHLDPRLTWELGRGHDWVVLACAHAATGDARYRDALARDLASWRRANPIGTGIHWVSAMEAAIRIHSLAWIAAFVREDRALLPDLAATIHEHLAFVSRNLSRFSSANNHVIVELSGVAVGARVLGDRERVRRRALAELDGEVARQVLSDGVDAEMAAHYHVFVMEALDLVVRLERAYGEPHAALERVVVRMSEYVAAIRCADGSLLAQGDSDDGEIVRACVREQAAPLPCPAAPRGSQRFEASGQIVLRSPRLVAAFDAGPFGFGSLSAHAHCDALALAVAIDGKAFLVDRGTYRYNGDRAERDRFRSTAAHNTLQLGTREQADAAGPFLWSRKPTVTLERCELSADGDLAIASHDGFSPWRHRRTLVRSGDLLCVIDDLEGPPTSEPITVRWHLAPDAGAPAHWIWTSSPARTTETPHSARYAARTVAPTIETTSHERILTIIGPRDRSAIAALRAFATARAISIPDVE